MPRSPRLLHRLGMHDEVIAHMRDRIRQIRKIMQLAHDPRMIEGLQKVIDEAETDIKKLRAEAGE